MAVDVEPLALHCTAHLVALVVLGPRTRRAAPAQHVIGSGAGQCACDHGLTVLDVCQPHPTAFLTSGTLTTTKASSAAVAQALRPTVMGN